MSELARIKEVVDIPMSQLVIGKSQVRLSDVGKEIDELAASIARVGLLEPIVVCPTDKVGQYEILTGQRRFLAHKELRRETIKAVVLQDKVDETTAKIISVTENLVRRDLNSKDLITVCTHLYKTYGSVKAVCDETGLSHSKVSMYVKYDRLKPEMKTLVDSGEVDMKAALKAQDVASVSGEYKPEEAVKLAKELENMSGAQRRQVERTVIDSPSRPLDEVIENAKSGQKITQMIVELLPRQKYALELYAADEGSNNGDAALTLIEEGLLGKGYLESEDDK